MYLPSAAYAVNITMYLVSFDAVHASIMITATRNTDHAYYYYWWYGYSWDIDYNASQYEKTTTNRWWCTCLLDKFSWPSNTRDEPRLTKDIVSCYCRLDKNISLHIHDKHTHTWSWKYCFIRNQLPRKDALPLLCLFKIHQSIIINIHIFY